MAINIFAAPGAYDSNLKKIEEGVRQSDCLVVGGGHRAVGLSRCDGGSRVTVVCIRSEVAYAKQAAFARGVKVVENDELSLFLFQDYAVGERVCITPDEIENPSFAARGQCDVVVVGDDKFAAGLRYDPKKMAAPTVIYKSFDVCLAKRLAQERKVFVVEDNSLAKSLMADCALNSEIPCGLWKEAATVYAKIPKIIAKYKKSRAAHKARKL